MSLIFIVGATATGKSELAVRVAQELDGEIVNADSMQLYRGMDIGTAKLTSAERGGIAHHLIDILDVRTDSSVADYQVIARAKIDELLAAGKSVVVVGGTGLYVKSILDELNFPSTDPATRARIAALGDEIGAAALHERLARLDPAAAAAIDPANIRRVVRALEVIEITGAPFTANLPRAESARYPQARQFGLVADRSDLRTRIDDRVELMWRRGLVAEVEGLIEAGILEGRTARAALGYSQVIDALAGRCRESEAKAETKRATRQYARRQDSWFARDERITWLKGSLSERCAAILSTIGRSR